MGARLFPALFPHWRKPLPERVLADAHRIHELKQVVGAARLRPDTRHAKTAEGLPADQGSRDFPVDIEVACPEILFCPLNVRGASRKEAPRERVLTFVGQSERLLDIFCSHDRKHGAEYLLLSDTGPGRDVREKSGSREVSFCRCRGFEDDPALQLPEFDIGPDLL